MARGLPRVDRCRAPTGSILRPLTTGSEWPSRVIGEASRDRACRVSVGRDKRTGKYVVRWRSDGRHRSKSFTYQRDAERWDREQKRSRELGVSFEPLRGSETLAEVVEGWWKAHVVTLEDNTRQAYRIVWARHIQPALGGVKIRSLTPGRVDAFRQYLEEAGVGEPTVAKALAIVSGACRFAVLRGLIDANPVRDVRKPKPRRKRFVGALAPSSVERIRVELLAAERFRDAVFVSTLAYTGLRPGETRALRWSDVRAGSLLVERAVAGRAIKATKNERLRAVRLIGALADDLAMWRELAPFSGDGDFVFANRTGAVTSDSDWRNWRKRVFLPAAASAGVAIGRPYDLRHSFASLLIHEGRSLAEVALQLGDAVATVASTYTHTFVEAEALPREPAADAIEAARMAVGVRQLYVGPEAAANGESGDPASEERADARTRTGDPFITSEVLYQLSYVGSGCSV
jgi:integrase